MKNVKGKNIVIKRIKVKRLFNELTYDFNNINNDVSVLIGPNGVGKTTIFNFISFVLKPTYESYEMIVNVPFEEFECILSDNTKLKLFKSYSKSDNFVLKMQKNNERQIILDEELFRIYDYLLFEKIPVSEFDLVLYRKFIYERRLNYREGTIRINHDSDRPFREYRKDFSNHRIFLFDNDKKFIDDLRSKLETLNKFSNIISVNYISSNRLFDIDKNAPAVEALKTINKNVKDDYGKLFKQYYDLTYAANDKIVNEYFKNYKRRKVYKIQNTRSSWNTYISKVLELIKFGLLDTAKNLENLFGKDDDKGKNKSLLTNDDEFNKKIEKEKKFMSIYIDAYSKTIEPFEPFLLKLKTFIEILNTRNIITAKKFSFDKEKGIILKVKNKELPLECMSSGEKNDFVMFYNLIFKSIKGGIILLDEPEISLHILLQQTVLSEISRICELVNSQAIIATHSPHILNGREDLILKGGPSHE